MAKAIKPQQSWRNRIVGYGEEAPEQLLANPLNFRIHPRAQQQALGGVLSEVGWVDTVLVNRTTGHVVDGHLRVELAISRGEPTVPVTYVDLTEAEEKLILATFDPLSAMAVADKEVLATLLSDVSSGEAAVQQLLEQLSNLNTPFDPNSEWQGMPAFQQDDLGYHKIIVHFLSEEDMVDFAQLIGQPISKKTKFIWHPMQLPAKFVDKHYVDES